MQSVNESLVYDQRKLWLSLCSQHAEYQFQLHGIIDVKSKPTWICLNIGFVLMWTILIVFTEFVSILLLFHILVFLGCEARGIFRTWTEPASLALEGDVLTTGLPRKSHTGICVKLKLQPQSHWEGLELYLFLLNTVYKLILKSSLF